MKNNLTIFNSAEFGEIRTVMIDGEPWFVAKDVATALGYKKTEEAVRTNVNKMDTVIMGVIDSLGREQKTKVANESGLYDLIFGSRLDSAKSFRRWVTSEVLPQIRKTGSYNATLQLPTTANERLQLCMEATVENDKRITVVEDEVEAIHSDITDLRENLPLFPVEADEIIATVKKKGTDVLGGKLSPAYHDTSIRQTVYQDIHCQIRRQFGIRSYKALPRRHLQAAIEITKDYKLPIMLAERVRTANEVGVVS